MVYRYCALATKKLYRVLDIQKWVDNIKTVEDERIKLAIMTANNHYAGFGPGTVNIFRNMLGLPEARWEEKKEEEEQQKHLEEYPATDSKTNCTGEPQNNITLVPSVR